MTNLIDWWKYENFRLLIYRLLQLSEDEYLLKNYCLLRDGHIANADRLNLGLVYTMLHIYMVGANIGWYSENYFHNLEQDAFDSFFDRRNHVLELSLSGRIGALNELYNVTENSFVSEALEAAKLTEN